MSDRDPEKTIPQKRAVRSTALPTRPTEDPESAPDDHQGAVETDVAGVTPPARGPADPTKQIEKEDDIDPTDDLTPG
jgi:hypothetical protein